MYLPIRTLRTSGIPKCRIASRTAFPCGSSTAAFGITITFAFTIPRYLSATTRTSATPPFAVLGNSFRGIAPHHQSHSPPYFKTKTSSAPSRPNTSTPTAADKLTPASQSRVLQVQFYLSRLVEVLRVFGLKVEHLFHLANQELVRLSNIGRN